MNFGTPCGVPICKKSLTLTTLLSTCREIQIQMSERCLGIFLLVFQSCQEEDQEW